MSTLSPEQKVRIAQACVTFVDALLAEGFDAYDIKQWVALSLERDDPASVTQPGDDAV